MAGMWAAPGCSVWVAPGCSVWMVPAMSFKSHTFTSTQVASSGKKFDPSSAPGYAEASAKKAADKQASLDAYNARVADLKAKQAATVAARQAQ